MQTLFLSFDSSSKMIFSLNWIIAIILPTILNKYWLPLNQLHKTIFLVLKPLCLEIKLTFSSNLNSGLFLIFLSLFLFIASMNLSGLLPYIFTPTSHLVMTLFLSIPLWLGIQLSGWLFNFNKMACHLVPSSTPDLLIPFLVLIESLSNVIRPMTLAVRLTANMTAGHLLMSLLGSSASIDNISIGATIIFVMLLLLTLEMAVALIQSYVFMLLSSLYTEESSFLTF